MRECWSYDFPWRYKVRVTASIIITPYYRVQGLEFFFKNLFRNKGNVCVLSAITTRTNKFFNIYFSRDVWYISICLWLQYCYYPTVISIIFDLFDILIVKGYNNHNKTSTMSAKLSFLTHYLAKKIALFFWIMKLALI
jgi:hypothetical protein